MKETLPPCSSGSSLEENPTTALTGLKSGKVLSRHYEKEDGLDRLFSSFPSSPTSLPPSLPKLSYSPSLPLSSFPPNVLSLLAFLSDSLGALLWKGSPERAPELSKVSGNNLELALLLPVPLSLESALGPEDPNSHHHAWSLLAAMAPW